jgi:hypothetical protein
MSIVAEVHGFLGERNDYDRGVFEGQRRGQAQVRPLRQAGMTHRGMRKRVLQHAHDARDNGGARATAGKIALITTMRPALQCAH